MSRMSEGLKVVRSFSAQWVELSRDPARGLAIVPTTHLRVRIGFEEFFLTQDAADDLAEMILRTSPEPLEIVMLGGPND